MPRTGNAGEERFSCWAGKNGLCDGSRRVAEAARSAMRQKADYQVEWIEVRIHARVFRMATIRPLTDAEGRRESFSLRFRHGSVFGRAPTYSIVEPPMEMPRNIPFATTIFAAPKDEITRSASLGSALTTVRPVSGTPGIDIWPPPTNPRLLNPRFKRLVLSSPAYAATSGSFESGTIVINPGRLVWRVSVARATRLTLAYGLVLLMGLLCSLGCDRER